MNWFLKKVKTYFKIRIHRFSILVKFFSSKKNKNKERILVFDIKDRNIFSRHLINPTLFFLRNNFTVIFLFRRNLINQFGYYYHLINKNPDVKITVRKPKSAKYFLTNRPRKSNQIELKPDMFGLENYDQNSHRIPPPMHPLVYEENAYNEVLHLNENLKDNKRAYNIVFAGSLVENDYKSFEWGDEIYVSRVDLIKEIKKNFSDEVFIPKNYEDYQIGSNKKICIVDRKYFSLSMKDYFTLLMNSEFAFCPPGLRQPFCHNLIEAMFCGSIPILQYAHLMPEGILDKRNSISYSSIGRLLRIIENILYIKKYNIVEMRNAVNESYLNFLKPESVVGNFERRANIGLNTLYIPAGT